MEKLLRRKPHLLAGSTAVAARSQHCLTEPLLGFPPLVQKYPNHVRTLRRSGMNPPVSSLFMGAATLTGIPSSFCPV